jgi:hypothetical protein
LTLRCKISRPGFSGSASAVSGPLPPAGEGEDRRFGGKNPERPRGGPRANRLAQASEAGTLPTSPPREFQEGPG